MILKPTGTLCKSFNICNIIVVLNTLISGCTCDKTGAEEGNQCAHKPNGDCRCKPTVTGANCDKCQNGYWGIGQDKLGCKSKF